MREWPASIGLVMVCMLLQGDSLSAGEPGVLRQSEIREFRVRVDGEPAGTCRLTTVRYGSHLVSLTAGYRLEVQGGPAVLYRFTNEDRETWKDGRLERFACRGQKDGRPFAVRAARNHGRLHVQANGHADDAAIGLGTIACWQLPPGCPADGTLPLIDGTTGEEVGVHFHYLGSDRLTVGARTNDCRHFELAGPSVREAWYDGLGRLVRQE